MRKMLAIAWLALGIGIAISGVIDTGEPHWRISWLAIDAVGALMACLCSLILYYDRGRKIGMAIATAFVLYCVYLFLLSFPPPLNKYSILCGVVTLLGITTLGPLARRRGPEKVAAHSD